jgi:hypothetical protein
MTETTKKPRGRPRKNPAPADALLIKMTKLEEKIDHIQKVTDEQREDIKRLSEQVNMGKGGLKIVMWLGGIIVAALAVWQGWKG